MGRKQVNPPEVIELYKTGHSTRCIAEKLGISKSQVGKVIKRLGLSRNRIEAVRMVCVPYPSAHWRTCRAQARKIVEKSLGRKLNNHEHVHHKDGDFTNNSIDNLEVLDAKTHAHLHHPPNPVPRHLRTERQAYMKEYLRNYRLAHPIKAN